MLFEFQSFEKHLLIYLSGRRLRRSSVSTAGSLHLPGLPHWYALNQPVLANFTLNNKKTTTKCGSSTVRRVTEVEGKGEKASTPSRDQTAGRELWKDTYGGRRVRSFVGKSRLCSPLSGGQCPASCPAASFKHLPRPCHAPGARLSPGDFSWMTQGTHSSANASLQVSHGAVWGDVASACLSVGGGVSPMSDPGCSSPSSSEN